MINSLRIAVLASGNGSNLQALLDACGEGVLPASVVMVISDRQNCYALERARKAGIPALYLQPSAFASRELFDREMHQAMHAHHVDLVCLAGFMRLLSKPFVAAWRGRAINIHPSLLPSFKGLNAISQALDYGVKITGCTVHWVSEEMDAGEIIVQKALPIAADDTCVTLTEKMHQLEHQAYVEAVGLVAQRLAQS